MPATKPIAQILTEFSAAARDIETQQQLSSTNAALLLADEDALQEAKDASTEIQLPELPELEKYGADKESNKAIAQRNFEKLKAWFYLAEKLIPGDAAAAPSVLANKTDAMASIDFAKDSTVRAPTVEQPAASGGAAAAVESPVSSMPNALQEFKTALPEIEALANDENLAGQTSEYVAELRKYITFYKQIIEGLEKLTPIQLKQLPATPQNFSNEEVIKWVQQVQKQIPKFLSEKRTVSFSDETLAVAHSEGGAAAGGVPASVEGDAAVDVGQQQLFIPDPLGSASSELKQAPDPSPSPLPPAVSPPRRVRSASLVAADAKDLMDSAELAAANLQKAERKVAKLKAKLDKAIRKAEAAQAAAEEASTPKRKFRAAKRQEELTSAKDRYEAAKRKEEALKALMNSISSYAQEAKNDAISAHNEASGLAQAAVTRLKSGSQLAAPGRPVSARIEHGARSPFGEDVADNRTIVVQKSPPKITEEPKEPRNGIAQYFRVLGTLVAIGSAIAFAIFAAPLAIVGGVIGVLVAGASHLKIRSDRQRYEKNKSQWEAQQQAVVSADAAAPVAEPEGESKGVAPPQAIPGKQQGKSTHANVTQIIASSAPVSSRRPTPPLPGSTSPRSPESPKRELPSGAAAAAAASPTPPAQTAAGPVAPSAQVAQPPTISGAVTDGVSSQLSPETLTLLAKRRRPKYRAGTGGAAPATPPLQSDSRSASPPNAIQGSSSPAVTPPRTRARTTSETTLTNDEKISLLGDLIKNYPDQPREVASRFFKNTHEDLFVITNNETGFKLTLTKGGRFHLEQRTLEPHHHIVEAAKTVSAEDSRSKLEKAFALFVPGSARAEKSYEEEGIIKTKVIGQRESFKLVEVHSLKEAFNQVQGIKTSPRLSPQ